MKPRTLRDHNERHLCQGQRKKCHLNFAECVNIFVYGCPLLFAQIFFHADSSTGVLTIHYNHQTCDSLLLCLQEKIKPTVPIVHFKSAKPPFIICMKLVRRLGHLREWQFCSGNSCVSILDPEKEQQFQLLSKCLPSNLCQVQLVYIIHIGKVNWEF